jgi:hypothetical protein
MTESAESANRRDGQINMLAVDPAAKVACSFHLQHPLYEEGRELGRKVQVSPTRTVN